MGSRADLTCKLFLCVCSNLSGPPGGLISVSANSEHRLEKWQTLLENTARWMNELHTAGEKGYCWRDNNRLPKAWSKAAGDSLGNADIQNQPCMHGNLEDHLHAQGKTHAQKRAENTLSFISGWALGHVSLVKCWGRAPDRASLQRQGENFACLILVSLYISSFSLFFFKFGYSRKHLEINKKENTMSQNIQNAAKAVLRGKCIAVSIHIKK